MPEPLHPSGAQVDLRSGDYTATVTEVGATLRALHHAGRPLLRGFGATEMASGGRGQVLLPWPNRIEGGRYVFAGRDLQLSLSEPARGNAAHGLVRWQPWRLTRTGPASVTASLQLWPQPGYPFSLGVEVSYELDQDGLRVQTSATNTGPEPAPYGHGMHPYLQVATDTVDDAVLELPAATVCPVDDRGVPGGPEPVAGGPYDFRAGRAVGAIELDAPFTDLIRGDGERAVVRLHQPGGPGVELWVDPTYRWLQLFTGDTLPEAERRRALAVEPMTCPPNAFRSGIDVVHLEPGRRHAGEWGIRAL